MILWSGESLLVVGLTFLLAGLVKGVVGLGLPTVALALLATTLGLKDAIVLMLVPAFATNVWQGLAGGQLLPLLRRLWPLLAVAAVFTWFGAGVLAASDAQLLAGLLGAAVFCYAALSLATPQIPPPGRLEPLLSPLVGAAAGTLCGLTGSFIPAVLYLQALGLGRDGLVQALGIAFTVASSALAVALAGHGLLRPELGALSALALAPAALGMALGQRLRRRLSEAAFRRAFFLALLGLGAYIAARAVL